MFPWQRVLVKQADVAGPGPRIRLRRTTEQRIHDRMIVVAVRTLSDPQWLVL